MQDLLRVGHVGLEVARPARRLRQRRGTRERLLTIRRHNGLAGTAAGGGIALTPPMLVDDPRSAFRVAPGPPRYRLDDNVHLVRRGHGKETEAQQSAELFHAGVAFAAASTPRGA